MKQQQLGGVLFYSYDPSDNEAYKQLVRALPT